MSMKLADLYEARYLGSKVMKLTGELTVDDREADQFHSKEDVTLIVKRYRDSSVGANNVEILDAKVKDGDDYLIEIYGLVGTKAAYLDPHDNRGWFLCGNTSYDGVNFASVWALEP